MSAGGGRERGSSRSGGAAEVLSWDSAATQVSTQHILIQTDIVSFQDSGFSCDGLVFGGYYADPATECQQYSVCLQVVQICTIFFFCKDGKIYRHRTKYG